MDIIELKKIQEEALKDKENFALCSTYGDAIETYLKNNAITVEFIDVIISGMDIDRGVNYYDYLESLKQNSLLDVWRIIKTSKIIKNDKKGNSYKFLFGSLYLSIINSGKMGALLGNIITTINGVICDDNSLVSVFGPIFLDYFVNELHDRIVLPNWDKINVSPEAILKFVNSLLMIDDLNKHECHSIRVWLENGKKYANEEIEKKNIESKIPKSQIDAFQELIKHYSDIEQQLRNSIYQIAFLEGKIKLLNDELSQLNVEKNEMKKTISRLNAEIEERDIDLNKAGKEIEERKKLNQVQVQYREDSQEALLQDIARALKAEYGDFIETEKVPMSEMLGEIYREKLKNIAKILQKKGIKVEE